MTSPRASPWPHQAALESRSWRSSGRAREGRGGGGGSGGVVALPTISPATAPRSRLFDASHPREKPCGGGVTGKALALLPPAPADDPLPARYASRLPLRVGIGRGRGRVASHGRWPWPRVASSTRGCSAARPRPVRTTWPSAWWKSMRRAGSARAPGRDECFDLIVGADGAGSLVRRSVPRADADCASAHGRRLVRPRHGADAGALHTGPPGLPLALPAARPRRRRDRGARSPWFRRGSSSAGSKRRWRATSPPSSTTTRDATPTRSPRRPPTRASILEIAGKGFALVGDAAALVDPITGEGIYYALRSALVLADTLRLEGSAGPLSRAGPRGLRPRAAEGRRLERALLRAGLLAPHDRVRRAEPGDPDASWATWCWETRATSA